MPASSKPTLCQAERLSAGPRESAVSLIDRLFRFPLHVPCLLLRLSSSAAKLHRPISPLIILRFVSFPHRPTRHPQPVPTPPGEHQGKTRLVCGRPWAHKRHLLRASQVQAHRPGGNAWRTPAQRGGDRGFRRAHSRLTSFAQPPSAVVPPSAHDKCKKKREARKEPEVPANSRHRERAATPSDGDTVGRKV